MILKGVTIEDNVIIGALTLVNRDIPYNSIALGIPAKIRKRDEIKKEEIEKIKYR